MSELTALCKELEHFETPLWAAQEILKHEIMTRDVIDPCCGIGILSEAAFAAGYRDVIPLDIHDWGYSKQSSEVVDFLNMNKGDLPDNATYFMNPPFSKAEDFVKKSFDLGARKVICFQRFAWWESAKREQFWNDFPPNRVYICGDRADCWRHDIPMDERGSGSPTAHAWFVFEAGQPPGTLLGHIRKPRPSKIDV